MLYLKEANIDDMQKEYEVITRIPFDENGFTNEYENCSFEEFKEKCLPKLGIKNSGHFNNLNIKIPEKKSYSLNHNIFRY